MIRTLFHRLYNHLRPIRVSGTDNNIENQSKFGFKFLINVSGRSNSIIIGRDCLLTNTTVSITGEHNQLIIDDNVRFMGPCRIIMNGNAKLHIKWNAGIRGVEFNMNGANIEVGELCMFSYGITLRNHDSHKVICSETNKILNPPKDIVLGKHVWVAQGASILKGCHIGENSVVGFGSVVTKSCASGSILAGNPARVVKENISWDY